MPAENAVMYLGVAGGTLLPRVANSLVLGVLRCSLKPTTIAQIVIIHRQQRDTMKFFNIAIL